jgi:serine/threonine-protein kinase
LTQLEGKPTALFADERPGHDAPTGRVGRFQIRDLIGQGATAKVFRAYDPEINRTLAIKVLQPELSRNEDYRMRFLREARGAGVLSHPNIVTVFDVGEVEDQPYIAMELIDGQSLGELLKEKKTLPVENVVDIGIQLAQALDYAHKRGIVHRDVKPGNIMMVKGTNTIKVADFGICRIEGGDTTQKTQVGDVLGTPNYMSPEQVLGQKVDSRSDLFSAGVVLFQLLTGALPFEGDTFVSVAINIVKSDPLTLDKLRPDLPLSLRRLVDRALKKQVDKRFQSGEEMAAALAEVAKELAETRRPKGRARIPLQVRWALIMAAVVAITMTVTAGFIQNRQYRALLDQVMGYGGSLAKFMATQSAVPMLSEDWAAIDVLVQDTVSRQEFSHLVVADHTNVIRGSNNAAEVGKRYVAPQANAVTTRETGVNVQSHRVSDGREVLDFEAPILFQGRNIGTVHLGIFQTPLSRVANLTLVLLGVLIVVTSVAVAVSSYYLAQRISGPLRVLRNSLHELAEGRYDYRIAEARDDEFGELYAAFDSTASALQQRHEPPSQPPAA